MSERPPITVRFTERDKALVLSAAGEIGYHEAPAYRIAIKDAYDRKPTRLIADLSGVTYMATPGLATLVEAMQISKRMQIPLVLTGLSDRVRALFEIARLHTVFKIVKDVDQAMTT